MQEIWEKIKDFPMYSVSSFGRVRNDKRGRVLGGGLDNYGYPSVILCNKGKRKNAKVHRLVAEAFIENPLNKPQINHKDGNKKNNNVSNLEWCTNQENQDHFWRVINNDQNRRNRSEAHKGKYLLSENPNAKSVLRIEDGKIFPTIKEAAENVGITYFHIGEVCNGKRKTAGGYHWQFVKETKNARVG